jgi:hypothetical protein
LLALPACGGSQKEALLVEAPLQGISADDQSRCEYRGRDDRDVQETAAPHSPLPNVRRVFGYVGTGDERRRTLLCREVDTNLDGIKDVVRTYNEQGEKLSELADSNYDGKVDTWLSFAGGRIHKAEFDRDGDGRPDVVSHYVGGRVSRVQRDTNRDGKADRFEVYADGRLERIGVDVNHDGAVDRWDRDENRLREEAEREARELERQQSAAAEDGEG